MEGPPHSSDSFSQIPSHLYVKLQTRELSSPSPSATSSFVEQGEIGNAAHPSAAWLLLETGLPQLVFLSVVQQPEGPYHLFANGNYEGVRFRLQMDLMAGSRSEAAFSLQPKTPGLYVISLKEK